MMEVIEKNQKTLLEDFDYAEKVRHLNLRKRIEWFIVNKKQMTQCEKWDAFYDIMEDYDIGDRDALIERINKVIRRENKNAA